MNLAEINWRLPVILAMTLQYRGLRKYYNLRVCNFLICNSNLMYMSCISFQMQMSVALIVGVVNSAAIIQKLHISVRVALATV